VDLHPLEGHITSSPVAQRCLVLPHGAGSCLARLDEDGKRESIQLQQDFKGYRVGHNIGGDLGELRHPSEHWQDNGNRVARILMGRHSRSGPFDFLQRC